MFFENMFMIVRGKMNTYKIKAVFLVKGIDFLMFILYNHEHTVNRVSCQPVILEAEC